MKRNLPPIVHVDKHIIVVDKPAELLSVKGRGPEGEDCLHGRLLQRWRNALVVHRLDRSTSGLIVFARGAAMQRAMSMAFAARTVRKRYIAVVAGQPPADGADAEGWSTIDLPLIVDWPARPRQKVDFETGRPSRTRWRAIGPAEGPWGMGTRLELEPVTGRSHQLRVHLMSIGHPIVGDTLYAPDDLAAAAPRLLLHAAELGFAHPADGRQFAWALPAPF